jgi:S1-C subfamily serine protease
MASLQSVRPYAALVAAAALGGGVAVGAVALLGGLDDGTEVVTETSPSSSTALQTPAPKASGALTVNEIYERAASGVVQITSRSRVADAFAPSTAPRALGSGFVVDKAGHIITNYHVIEGADEIRVSFSNRDTVEAELVGTDPSTDLALLEVETSSSGLTPLMLGDSGDVRVGDDVVAIGNPFGLDRTVTAGIVSALQRQIQAPNRFFIDHVIQTDAPINQGNSGGPLLNVRGQVIGVNTQIETGSIGTGNVGIGFAVPSNTVKDVLAQLLRNGRVDHPYLGISGQPVSADLADTYNLPVESGVLVEDVRAGTGADKAGLQDGETQVVVAGETYVLGGDIIVTFDGKPISSVEELSELISGHAPGDKVKLGIYRDTKRSSVTVTLGRRPSSPQG